MNFGLTLSEFDYLQNELVAPLKEVGATVWIFGSRARGDHKKFSDVDILVESHDEKINTLLSRIREKFEEGNFPYKIDLLLIEDLAQSYKDSVLKDRILLN